MKSAFKINQPPAVRKGMVPLGTYVDLGGGRQVDHWIEASYELGCGPSKPIQIKIEGRNGSLSADKEPVELTLSYPDLVTLRNFLSTTIELYREDYRK